MITNYILRPLVIAIFASVICAVAYSQAEMVDEDSPRITAAQRLQLYRLNQELKTKARRAPVTVAPTAVCSPFD